MSVLRRSETARGIWIPAAAIASAVLAGPATGEPRGGEVLSGGAVSVTQDGTHTQIETSTEQTRMRWDGFDIAIDESVHVQQPTTGSTLVNHVSDASVTTIDGLLSSNGRVWILNPAGVYFGGSAIVEVAGLVAAAGTITDEAYVIGARSFSDLRGAVVNYGSIQTGESGAALIGRAVENHGQIVTQGGDLVLAAGDDVLLVNHDTYIQVRLDGLAGHAGERPAVLNTGVLDAGQGRARLAAGDFLGLAIRNQGEIHARRIEVEAGRESVVEIAGTLDASSDGAHGTGGHVEVTGDYVVVEGARIDASGGAGGGEIWIGGEVGGPTGGEHLETARGVFVGPGSELVADARETGDGGEIAVWGDEVARVQGRISARGGAAGGDGGFVETSSKGVLQALADVDVSAPNGDPGTWLLDPVNIEIVDDVTPGTLIEPEFDFDLLLSLAQPQAPAPDSIVRASSLVAALVRGGSVVVTTQVAAGADPGTDEGDIRVSAEVVVPDGAPLAPNSAAELVLLAADDIFVDQRIASEDADLALSVTLFANDNPLVSGSVGQPEPQSQQRLGDVRINADIATNGGALTAQGANVVIDGAQIDTSRIAGDVGGGAVDLTAIDVAESGMPDDVTGNVQLLGGTTIATDGGDFTSRGEAFLLEAGSSVDVFRPLPNDPEVPGDGFALVDHSKQVDVLGDVRAQSLILSGASGGAGDVQIGGTLAATEIELSAGDGAGGDGAASRVAILPTARFEAPDSSSASPDTLLLTQDAPIRYDELPQAAQFGSGDVVDLFYLLATLDGAPDPADDDIVLDDATRFADSDLILNAPDSIEILSPLLPRNLTILVEQGFTLDAALAPNLALGTPADADDGLLVVHAARVGTGDLVLADGIQIASVPRIALRAGDLSFGPGTAGSSVVTIPATAQFPDTTSFEVRQDADLGTGGLPALSAFDPAFENLTLISDSGSVTISDASKVNGTKLTVAAAQDGNDDVVFEQPVTVRSADLGGLGAFEVRPALLDQLTLANERVLTLRAAQGRLSFAPRTAASAGQDLVPLAVYGDRIELIGASIDVVTNRPVFQVDASVAEAPRSFVFQQNAQVSELVLPTAESFPGGVGPRDLFAIQSLTDITLSHQANAASQRGWTFPVQDTTRVILSAPQLAVIRTDGSDLTLGARDDVWGTNIFFAAVFDPANPGEPIAPTRVVADAVNSIRGFDPGTDFEVDPMAAPDTAARILEIDQDGSFELRAGIASDGLPDALAPASGYQPEIYRLTTRKGSIVVENDLFEDGTNVDLQLELRVLAPDRFIDFEGADSLDVRVLVAEMGGPFEIGRDGGADPPDGAWIGLDRMDPTTMALVGSESITFTAGFALAGSTGAPGLLSFAPGVALKSDRLALRSGISSPTPSALVDARSNAPSFDVQEFELVQGGEILSGLGGIGGVERLPDRSQFTQAAAAAIERYRLQSLAGDVEINDPDQVLIARTVEILAGTEGAPMDLTLRADVPDEGTPRDLVLVQPGLGAEAVRLQGARVSLEAPNGSVDAGDPRARLTALGSNAQMAIRQDAPVIDSSLLPDNRQLLGSDDGAEYRIQSLGGITLDSVFAERVEGNDLVLVAGVPQEAFDLALGSNRQGDPDPAFPDAVYDRLADLDHDGDVDAADVTAAPAVSVAIDDPQPFDLVLASLDIQSAAGDGAPIGLGSVHIQTESDQVYGDEIELRGDAELTARSGLLEDLSAVETAPASSVTFERAVFAETPGSGSLVVNATNRVHFMEDVGVDEAGAAARLDRLEINLEQLLQLEDLPPTPRVEFGKAPAAGQAPGLLRVLANEILLNPQAGDGGSEFVRAQVPELATFFSRGDDLVFELGDATTPGRFVMGQNEKLAVAGSELRIDAHGGDVTIGDLSALDLVEVRAGRITIQRRGKGSVVRANGEIVHDGGVDFVAREILFEFDGSDGPDGSEILHRNQAGSGKDARFGIADPANAPDFMREFSVLALQYNLLAGSALPLDGVPDGVSRAELARAFPDRRREVPIGVPASHRVRQPDALETIGVRLRPPTAAEVQSAARGAAVFDDRGSTASPDLVRISESRLVAEEVEQTARLHREVFGEEGERSPEIRAVLQSAVDDYKRSTGARRVVGFELRRYVYNRPSTQFHAYQLLQSLDALFRHHRRSGLTHAEYSEIQRGWLESIAPEGVTTRELSEFIHPSRYVRSRDVLDVFGD